MSGAERTDIASAHLKGLNESGGCANVHIEPSRENQFVNSQNDRSVSSVCLGLSKEPETGCYADSVLSKENEDGGSVTKLDVGKSLVDGLNAIGTVYEGLGMLENKVQGCELDGMGNRIPSCSVAQQTGDYLNPANVDSEELRGHGDDSLASKPVDELTGTSIVYDNEETLGKTVSPVGTVGEKPPTENREGCYESAKHRNGSSTCKDGEVLGESSSLVKGKRICVAMEDVNQVSSCDPAKKLGESMSYTPCHEVQTCDSSRLEHPINLSSKKESSDLNVDKGNSVVLEPVVPNLQNKSDGFGYQSSCNRPAEEKASSQFQIDWTGKGKMVEGSSENDYQTGSVDDLLNNSVLISTGLEFISPEGVANSSKMEKTPEILKEGNHKIDNNLQFELKEECGSDAAPDTTKVEQTAESNIRDIELSPTNGGQSSLVEEVDTSQHGVSDSSCGIGKNKSGTSDVEYCPNEHAGSHSGEITGKLHVVVFGCPAKCLSVHSKRGRRSGNFSAILMRKKYPQRSSMGRTRTFPPGLQGNQEVPEPTSNLENKTSSTGKRRGRKKKRGMEAKSHDEFSRMRTHLRYLLHRIRYEQNLLDAYSSEGWRGQSLEKLRPEKELQRAKADINRSKLKIRDLFQHLDSVSAEGRFPDSLFDSEGLIDSEDIFCAKCGSKELSADNDIILCDGSCERGFHQFCLEPPLRTEEIPPGDQGWLCPACDCKADCIGLLNDSQATKLSIEDSWEKVFPEAVASSGNELDDITGLPSDDSEDNDYNPDGADDDAKVEGSGSSTDGSDSSESDSSDFSSVSEDLGAIGGNDQYLGLPSDDSEDDDFDPDKANTNDDVEQESSSSDFTSASEDLGAAVRNDGCSDDDETMVPVLEPDRDLSVSSPVSGRRHVERLDYKKLYDETYGNAPSDSGDDEEWISTGERKGSTEKGGAHSSIGNASVSADGKSSAGPSRRRGGKKLNLQATNGSPAQLKSSEKASCGGHTKRPHNRLGEAVTRRLYESFKENQYPDRTTKEKLAKELGLSPKRVDKWFGNARWSFHHHPERIESSMAAATSQNISPSVACNGVGSASGDTNTASGYVVGDSSHLDGKDSAKSKSASRTSRKRKNTEGHLPVPQNLNSETSKGGAQTDSLQTPEVETDTSQTPVAQHGRGRKRKKLIA